MIHTKTFFSRVAMPANLLTVTEWRRFAGAVGRRSFENAARYYADQTGGALILRADDRLVSFTRLEDGAVRKTTFKPGTWAWA